MKSVHRYLYYNVLFQGMLGFPGIRGLKGDDGSRGLPGDKGDKGMRGRNNV